MDDPDHVAGNRLPHRRIRRIATVVAVIAGATGVIGIVQPSRTEAAVSPGTTARVSVADTGEETTVGRSADPALSGDGRYVVFESESALAGPDRSTRAGDHQIQSDIYRRDRDADGDGIFEEVGVDPRTGLPQTRTELVSVGVVQREGILVCAPPDLVYPDTEVGQRTATESVTCSTDGPGPVTIGSTGVNGSPTQYIVTDGCAGVTLLPPLAGRPADTCSVGVAFAPTRAGTATSTLDVVYNDSSGVAQARLAGVGHVRGTLDCTPPNPDSNPDPNTFDFGGVVAGASASVTVMCTAAGPDGARVAIRGFSGLDPFGWFPRSGGSCTDGQVLEPSATCTVIVEFHPDEVTDVDDYEGGLVVAHDGSPELDFTYFEGTGVAAPPPRPRLRGTATPPVVGKHPLAVRGSAFHERGGTRTPAGSRSASTGPGGQLYSTGNPVQVTVLPPDAVFDSELWIFDPAPAGRLATNRDVGAVIDVGSYPAGIELVFGIRVYEAGLGTEPFQEFRMGPASRNPDDRIHANVTEDGPGCFTVGFNDQFPDEDFNDNVFRFCGGVAPTPEPGPVPGAPVEADGPSVDPVISSDGRFVAFSSTANNLLFDQFTEDDVNFQSDIFVRDMQLGATYVVPNDRAATQPTISADGTQLAYRAEDVDPACVLDCVHVVIADATNRLSPVQMTMPEGFDSDFDGLVDVDDFGPGPPAISADGRHVVAAADEAAIVVFDRDADNVDRVERVDATVDRAGVLVPVDHPVEQPAISGDGQLVVFTERPFDRPTQVSLVDRDLDGDGTWGYDPVRVGEWYESIAAFDGRLGDGSSSAPVISSDGRYVAFQTAATNLGSVESDPTPRCVGSGDGGPSDRSCVDIIVRDRYAPAGSPLELASVASFEAPAAGDSRDPAITTSGRFIAFTSDADNLLAAATDTNGQADVFVRQFTPLLDGAPDPRDFGTVLVGDSATVSVTFRHVGFGPLNPSSVTIGGADRADYAVNADTCIGVTLHQGDTCLVSVRYRPAASATRTATLRVHHDGNRSPASVRLTGGAGPKVATLAANPDKLLFGEQLGLTASTPKTVQLTNTGNTTVTFKSVFVQSPQPGGFTVTDSTCHEASLKPDQACAVSVTFAPPGPGEQAAALVIDDTATGSPHLVGLQGAGATPTVAVNPGVVAPGSVTVATGANFPPDSTVALAWVEPGAVVPGGFSESPLITTTGPAGSPTAGSFAVELLLLPNTRVGGRTLLATVDGFAANQSLLVTPATLQSPDFTNR